MSSAEPTLGADLYIKSVNAGLPKLFTSGGEQGTKEDFAPMMNTAKEMARFLFKNGIVKNDADGNPQRDDAKIRALSEKDEEEFLPLYNAAVQEQEKGAALLIAEGKADHVEYLHSMHIPEEFEVTDTVTRVRSEDLQAVVTTSLNLLEAVQKDPANAAFVKGLDNAALDSLWNVLEGADYLMPGENPNRKEPIGEQELRGTPEEREAVFFQASAVVSNLELDTVTSGDRPAQNALLLRNAVQGAQTEQVEVTGLNATPDMFLDSDLHKDSATSLYQFLNAANRMFDHAKQSDMDLENIVVPEHLAESTAFWLKDAMDKGVHHALGSGNFEAPGIDAKFGKELANAMKWADEAFKTDAVLTSYVGDEGGALTQEGAMQDEVWGIDNAFDREDEGAKTPTEEFVEDNSADKYLGTAKMVPLNSSMMDVLEIQANKALEGPTQALDKLRMHAGRAASEMADLQGGGAAFLDLEDAMGANRVATTPEVSNRLSEVMTTTAWRNMNPDRRDKLRVAQVVPGRGPFKGYMEASPGKAYARMTKYLDDNMLGEDGKPNLDLRRFLRDASQMPVIANTRQAGDAVRDYAVRFVERDNQEHKLRIGKEIKEEDLASVDFSTKDIQRMVSVVQASGSKDPTMLTMGEDGFATLSHVKGPEFRAAMINAPAEVANAGKSPRPFGGHIPLEQLKAGVETGADTITVKIHGETPIGVIGKLEEKAPVKAKTKRYEDVVLS